MTTFEGTSVPITLRPSWDDTWLAAAAVMGKRSLCVRSQVGCVVVASDNRVVASGYNGPPAGFPHDGVACARWCHRSLWEQDGHVPEKDYSDCPALHAEANALSVGDRRDRVGGTLYVNSHVCFSCAKLVANSGLRRLVVRPDVPAEHRLPYLSYQFLQACGLVVEVRG